MLNKYKFMIIENEIIFNNIRIFGASKSKSMSPCPRRNKSKTNSTVAPGKAQALRRWYWSWLRILKLDVVAHVHILKSMKCACAELFD